LAYQNFLEVIEKVQENGMKRRVAVAAADDEHTLEAVFKAKKDGIVEPILIGNQSEIQKVLSILQADLEAKSIIHVADAPSAARKAVELIHENQADFIMKGKIQTSDLLKAVVNKENGLGTGKIMSHLVLHEIPGYHKLLAVTDGGMMMYPNMQEKKQILENAVSVYKALGYDCPKVAVLTAVESINPKMPETVDAYHLKQMNQEGQIIGCLVEGPISYDLAMSKESAKIKGFVSLVTGDADILVVPNINVGNILGKALVYSAGAKMAGFIVGAKVPIVLTSRGSSSEEKYLSLVLSALAVSPAMAIK
jgi:phosphate butyryltransferase